MSQNQSRGERSESAQYRKTGRSNSFNQQRQFSGGASGRGGGGGGGGASSNSSNASNRSYNKKYNNNGQGGHLRSRSPNVSSAPSNAFAAPGVPNGAHQQQPVRSVVSDAPVTSTFSSVKTTDGLDKRNVGAATSIVPYAARQSILSAAVPESKGPTTPAKAPGDSSKSFPLQFGSISPGVVNGMQIPARTSSAPPNLDEQKKAQARHESVKVAPPVPIPSISKQHLPKKDAEALDKPNAGEPQTQPKAKKDVLVSAPPHMIQTQKPSVHPIPGMHMQLPFHQLQVPVQFGGPHPQIQSQAMSGTSLPMPMSIPLSMGNPPGQQPMFVSGLPPHPMQSQGMMHQGQSLNFPSQMGPQMNPQLGNIGMNMPPPFPHQQPGNYNSSRKTVKITHPETHEELRLDSSPGQRSFLNMPPQSQPIPSYPNHHMNLYPNLFPPGSSVSHTSTQVLPTSQPIRSYSQVTVKAAVGSHAQKEPQPPKSSLPVGNAEVSKPSRLHGEDSGHLQRRTEQPSSTKEDSVHDSNKSEHGTLGDSGQKDQVEGKSTSLASLPLQLPENEAVIAKCTSSSARAVTEVAKESLSTAADVSSEVTNSTSKLGSSNASSSATIAVAPDDSNITGEVDASKTLGTKRLSSTQSNLEAGGRKEEGIAVLPEKSMPDTRSLETSLKSLSLESPEIISESEVRSDKEVPSTTGGVLLDCVVGESAQKDETSISNMSSTVPDSSGSRETTVTQCTVVDQESAPIVVSSHPEGAVKPENGDNDNDSGGLVSPTAASVKDRVMSDANVVTTAVPRGKKKKKELYRKAEAAGTSSDLYMAYKGPEKKKETTTSAKLEEITSTVSINQTSANVPQDNAVPGKQPAQSKVEPDDWEDAEVSPPHLQISSSGNEDIKGDTNGLLTKRYSRDFLLKFVEHCTDLPEGFEVTTDIAPLMVSTTHASRDYHGSGRNTDRTGGNSRPDRRGIGLGNDDKWNKFPGPHLSGRGDMHTDFSYAGNIVGFLPGQGGNYGVLRNPRAQTPMQYLGGILPGSMQSLGLQSGLQRNNSDSDRWQRGAGFHKGLMPSPQAQLPMHRAENKYEIGKVADEEEAKQRQLKAILNKLTPQNFEKLFEQVKQVNIDNVVTLSGVISQIFDKALMEPTFCEMYANFCSHLAAELPQLSVDNQKITFKRLLLNKCQEEFERGEREEEEANKEDVEGENTQTAEEREEKRVNARRRMLGNIRLIGELYKKKMLTERIMHECINKLLGQQQNPDEENIEALCKLMSTIGEMIDHPRAQEYMDFYFNIMAQLSNNMKLSSRVRFMLRDAIDLRKNKWQQRRKVEGPKKIEEVHRDAAQERQAQASRLARAPSFGSYVRRTPPMEYAPRSPSVLPSPSPHGFRAVSPHVRSYGTQDSRAEERFSFENRTMSVPLTQRPLGDDSITLGPQGGLARGMAFRGQPSGPSIPLGDISSSGDARRMGPGLNGSSYMPQRASYGQREDLASRYAPDRYPTSSVYEQLHPQEQSVNYGNREARTADHRFDRSKPASPTARGGPATSMQHSSMENVLSEDVLRDKSIATIKEFYSARDENEVALCIKDLNSPSFIPSMISIWITDSFERKDMERDLLSKLLVNLTKSRDGIFSEDQLVKGFESVLMVLEDAENDAPRAGEFLGRIFARVIMENIVSLSEIGRLIYEGGEEKGQVVETGLAAKVLGSILDVIKLENGDSVLNEILLSSNLRLDNFRPPGYNKPLIIDKFI